MNRRVWVTRDEEQDGPLCTALRNVGLEPLLEPVIARRIVADARSLLEGLHTGDWLVVTSPFAAAAIGQATAVAPAPAGFSTAAVGEMTAAALQSHGFTVDLISPDATGISLWAALWPRVSSGSIVRYPRSAIAEAPAPPQGVRLEAPVLYSTEPCTFDPGVSRRCAVVAVASPSAAASLARLETLPLCASIGPTTTAALRRLGMPVWVESPAHTLADLARCIAAGLSPPARP